MQAAMPHIDLLAPGADLASYRARIAADHRGAAMTDDALLDMARELNSRGEAYALVTVVRAIAPTSAYLGAQAIVLADGTLHGWIGGGCAKSVVIERRAKRHRERRAEARAHQQRPDLSRRRCRALHDVLRQQRQHRAVHSALQYSQRAVRARNTPAADEARFLAERLRIRLTDTRVKRLSSWSRRKGRATRKPSRPHCAVQRSMC